MQAKLQAEVIIKDYAFARKSFKVAILRYFNVIGADPKARCS